MKILLLGEYSNVHATLADGLRAFGHKVTVASNGDFWKNYPRDISLCRREGKLGGLMLMAKIYSILPKLRGYDAVQLINPMFVELKAERIFNIYDYIKKHNKRMFLAGYGMDWYWVHGCTYDKPLRYSDFNIGDTVRTTVDAVKEQRDWIGTTKERLNKYIANDADGIVTGLYEYQVCYHPYFPDKTTFIPFPIKSKMNADDIVSHTDPLKLFIGINKGRSVYKGTDIMLKAAQDIVAHYPGKVELRIAESVPFSEYVEMMNGSDAILDQLYSYTPAMNSLEAMSRGIICIGGGEPENYDILGEKELRPIINVLPSYESVYREIESLVKEPWRIDTLKRQGIIYIQRHHDYIKVAEKYENLYMNGL